MYEILLNINRPVSIKNKWCSMEREENTVAD